MQWVYLGVAVIFEVLFALGANASKGFTRLVPSILTLLAAAGGIFTLSLALRQLDVGVGYTIWTGIGSIGIVLFGVLIFHERLNAKKVISFTAIIVGVVGLRLIGG